MITILIKEKGQKKFTTHSYYIDDMEGGEQRKKEYIQCVKDEAKRYNAKVKIEKD